ncbi:hypothetical protein HYW76_05090 [Candidatus Pacearchaeota archaeon]|nr:hypothetical protein [Candidatus Pacearchaeota archaeon]
MTTVPATVFEPCKDTLYSEKGQKVLGLWTLLSVREKSRDTIIAESSNPQLST